MQPVTQATPFYYCFEKPEIMINNPELFWFTVENQAKVGVHLTDSGKWEKSAEAKSHERTQKCVQASFEAINKFFKDMNNFNKSEGFSEKVLETFEASICQQFKPLSEDLLIKVEDCYFAFAKRLTRKTMIEGYRERLKDVELNKLDLKNLPSSIADHPERFSSYFSSIRIFIEKLPDLIWLIEAFGPDALFSSDLTHAWKNSDFADKPTNYVDGQYKWVCCKDPHMGSRISESLHTLRRFVFFRKFTFMQMIVLDITEEEIAKMLGLLRDVHSKHGFLKEFEEDAKQLDYFLKELKPLLKATLFKDVRVEEAPKAKAPIIEDVD